MPLLCSTSLIKLPPSTHFFSVIKVHLCPASHYYIFLIIVPSQLLILTILLLVVSSGPYIINCLHLLVVVVVVNFRLTRMRKIKLAVFVAATRRELFMVVEQLKSSMQEMRQQMASQAVQLQ